MRDDQPSSTAAFVCAGRATAHQMGTVEGFSDPFAERLLPDGYSNRIVKAIRSALRRGAHMFALRTVAIDEGIREVEELRQLVILGAGLDARAWRMEELADVDVFEVDHPATQRYKRERARDFPEPDGHHFVAVDFERDSLEEKLDEAGHRPDQPTVWVWEGVTMYLQLEATRATLKTVADRSADGSRLLVTYQPAGLPRVALASLTRWFGEPLVASYSPAEMGELLAEYGFTVTRDEDYADWHERWGTRSGLIDTIFSRAERLATADL